MNRINTSINSLSQIICVIVFIVSLIFFFVPINIPHLDIILIAALALAFLVN